MFYSGASAGGGGGGAGISQQPSHSTRVSPPSNGGGSTSGYVDVNQLSGPQNFVVISSNSNDGGASSTPSGSGGCSCTAGYAMTCGSMSCVNKFQQHNQVHMSHPPPQQQQIISTTTSGEQIVTYSLPAQPSQQDNESQHEEELSSEMMHDMAIDQSIEEVTNAVLGDMKIGAAGTRDGVSDGGPTDTVNPTTLSRADEKELRRQRLAELARLRYQNLSKEEKKAVNSRRMLLRKRKRQREREMEELEQILRASNDIEEDAVFIGDLREKRQRESRARAARSRYHSMTPEERRVYNQKRRMRQLGLANGGSEPSASAGMDTDVVKEHIKQQNARKAELARQRYHRMSAEERKLYNKRRTESLRRRRMEEETLLATPAGQIDSDALQRAQQIMIRNAIRAEKARERYKRKVPEERERKRTPRQTTHKMVIKQEHHYGHPPPQQVIVVGGVAPPPSQRQDDSGDILSAIERDLERRTQEARQVLQQRRDGILPTGPSVLHVKQEEILHHHHHQHPEVINVCPPTTILHGGGAASIHSSAGGPFTQIVHAAPAGGATLMHGGAGEVKPTKYVQYMQLPAGTTQSGILLADGQFVALQDVHGYSIEQPGGFDNNFQHINPTTAVLRTAGPPGGPPGAPQPIIIGQRVELVSTDQHGGTATAVTYHPHHSAAPGVGGVATSHHSGGAAPNTIHVVNYASALHQQHHPQQQQHHTVTHHHHLQQPHQIIAQEPPPSSHHHQQPPSHHHHAHQQHHYITQQPQQQIHHQQAPPPQQHHHHTIINPATASTSTNTSVGSGAGGEMTVLEQKIMNQRAKRAERARRRYHEMSAEARHEFNAKRAHALKMARLKDEELCRLGDEIDANGAQADDELRRSIEQARIRRAKRAETARQKYQKMSPKERKIHNAMRDAQRRQRKREMEEDKVDG